MKKINSKYIITLCFSASILLSCGPNLEEINQECDKTAKTFFKLIKHKNYKAAIKYIDKSSPYFKFPLAQFDSIHNHPLDGKLISSEICGGFSSGTFTKSNFGCDYLSTNEFCHQLIFEKGSYDCQITIINKGDGYKVSSLSSLTKNDVPF